MKDISAISDEALVDIIRNSDKERYAEIIRRYQAKLVRYARAVTGDDHMGDDAVQEAFIKAYRNLNGFDTKKKVSSWMYRIVHNEAMNMFHLWKKKEPIESAVESDSGMRVEDEYIRKELIRHAQACLEKMRMKYREPLTLYYMEEKSYEEISDILRIPAGTVATRINRAKGIMKNICEKNSQ